MTETTHLTVVEPSQVGQARREAEALTSRLRFAEPEAGRVALVATEMARNLVAHAQDGALILRPLVGGAVTGVDVLALDRGPGRADVGRCLADGHSTRGTPGNGLGAIERLSATFDIHSVPGRGTALVARPWAGPSPVGSPLDLGVVCLPWPGESECGDTWAEHQQPGRSLLLVADGLGHGPAAATAAQRVAQTFRNHAGQSPGAILQAVHETAQKTRGAVAAVAEVVDDQGELRFAGVGNISGFLLTGGVSRGLVSHNGTLGHHAARFQAFTQPWSDRSVLVLHSDGLASHWDLDGYPGLEARHPALIAGVLYRDFARGRDDVTVLVARTSPEGEVPS